MKLFSNTVTAQGIMTDKKSTSPTIDRRTLLTSAVFGAGVAVLPAEATMAEGERKRARQSLSALTAQATEGPYYLPLNLMRADISEGLPGIPIDICFTVVDERGLPYVGAFVDVWHCNAQGIYSGFEQPGLQSMTDTRGQTFLRGVQPVDADGETLFHSVYPGWYHGRTTHIHFKVRYGSRTNLTSQFFLPDTLSEFLYDEVPAYRRVELRDTLNSDDGIAILAGDTVQGSVRETKGRYLVALVIRVDRAAIASDNDSGGRAGPPPGPPGIRPDGRPEYFPDGPNGRRGPPLRSPALQGDKRVLALLPDAPRINSFPGRGDPPPV